MTEETGTGATGAIQVDTALVRQLAQLLDETSLTEIEVQDGDRRIKVARKLHMTAAAPAYPAPAALSPASPVQPSTSEPVATGTPVKSPMVGTVYLAAEPTARPFVIVGDTVAEGQTLVIIEAMKVMNTIAAPRAGKVIKVCVENGQPVEYDQSLVVLD